MLTISDHLKRIRKEAVQNDFITFAWVMYSAILIVFFTAIGYEAIFYLSSTNCTEKANDYIQNEDFNINISSIFIIC